MTTHKAKSWTHFYQAITAGEKTHDLRDMKDRNYRVGDTLILQEYDPFKGDYTGNECKVKITYITSQNTPCAFSSSVLQEGYCILSIQTLENLDRLKEPYNYEG